MYLRLASTSVKICTLLLYYSLLSHIGGYGETFFFVVIINDVCTRHLNFPFSNCSVNMVRQYEVSKDLRNFGEFLLEAFHTL